eukprot:TRINITY_DN2222_c0_g1_i2.p1 TRINITY_DN2222_c0_g1~~TRINITY_DN2222_c0_g1_i2.p1  ORF type:complete len:201 (-),score=57.71 TRINITY_DN2222_c0_g1_i2:652-1254(-)
MRYGDIESGNVYTAAVREADIEIRHAFLRKVYSLLTLMLLITAGTTAIFLKVDSVRYFVQHNIAMYYAAIVIPLVLLFVLFYLRKHHPWNLILLGFWTLGQSYLVATMTTYFEVQEVLEAAVITFTVFLALTLFVFQTRINFSFLYIPLMVLSIILIGGMIVGFFIPSTALRVSMMCLGAALFSLYILFDTWLIMKRLEV